jgi:dGTPase
MDKFNAQERPYLARVIGFEDQFLSVPATTSIITESSSEDQVLWLQRTSGETSCDPYRTAFQHDRDRIIHSRAFRRLMHKTQVFISPDSEHIRTRLTHSLEVMQIARTVARYLGANEDLTEAISLGHDLGHTPFGHRGESVLDGLLRSNGFEGGFQHAGQGWRIVTYLEHHDGGSVEGLDLTNAVAFGILRHSGKYAPGREAYGDGKTVDAPDEWGRPISRQCTQTFEEQIVRISDDIAWINHDWEDGVRSGLLSNSLLGPQLIRGLGVTQRQRIDRMVQDLVHEYTNTGIVGMSADMRKLAEMMKNRVRRYLWECDMVSRYSEESAAIIEKLFRFFMSHVEKLPEETQKRIKGFGDSSRSRARVIADHIAGMTDEYCLRSYEAFIYSPFSRFEQLHARPVIPWIRIKEEAGSISRTEAGRVVLSVETSSDFSAPTGCYMVTSESSCNDGDPMCKSLVMHDGRNWTLEDPDSIHALCIGDPLLYQGEPPELAAML